MVMGHGQQAARAGSWAVISPVPHRKQLVNWRWGEAINPHSMLPQILVSSYGGTGFPPFLCHYCEAENTVTNIFTAKSYPLKVWIKGNTAPKVWQISKLCPSQDLVLTFMSTAETCVLSPFLPVLGIIFKQVSWCIVNMTMYIWSVFFERFWCMWCSLQLGNCLNEASSLLLVKVSSWLCNPAMCLTLSLR